MDSKSFLVKKDFPLALGYKSPSLNKNAKEKEKNKTFKPKKLNAIKEE